MARLGSRLVAALAVAMAGTLAYGGCATGGGADPDTTVFEGSPTEPGGSAKLPAPSEGSSGGGSSGGSGGGPGGVYAPDGGRPDAASPPPSPDAGPPPTPGDPCSTLSETVARTCGKCGWQKTVCLRGADGAMFWSDYGDCLYETGECLPGSSVVDTCGMCGTLTRTCSSFCKWQASTCTGEPPNACMAGDVEYLPLGCPVGTYRRLSCDASCQREPASLTCVPPPSTIDISRSVGGTSSTVAILTANEQIPSTGSFSCPLSLEVIETPYAYVQIHNPLSRAVVVTIWTARSEDGPLYETILAAYEGATPPSTVEARKMCLAVSARGNAALTGNEKLASLDGNRAVAILPHGTISVYVGAEKSDELGPVRLRVRTDMIAP